MRARIRLFKLFISLFRKRLFFNEKSLKFSKTNILIIDEIIPEYNKDSGSRRLKEIITILLEENVNVFLLANYRQHRYKSDYFDVYEKMGVYVYKPSIYKFKVLTIEKFIKLIAPNLDYAWLHRPHIFNKYYKIVKETNSETRLVYDMVDFHYVRLNREYEINPNESLKKQMEDTLQMEMSNSKIADCVIAISEIDKELLLKYSPESNVRVLSNIHQFITRSTNFNSFNSRKNLLFVGNFDHTPNRDAILFLNKEIMPLVWQKNPEIKVIVIGSNVKEEILNLNSEKFNVLGFIDDIEVYFNESKIFIAPLRFGAGIKGKIGQSLEYSLPVITTNVGAEGFLLGEHENDMVANTCSHIAEKIIDLYENEALWNSLSNHSEIILRPFSIETTRQKVKGILKELAN